MSTPISRKNFLRLAGVSAGALAIDGVVGRPAAAAQTAPAPLQGRVDCAERL